MSREYRVAVVGATGLIGEAIIELLEKREFPVETLFLLADTESAGQTVFYKEQSHKIELLESFDFSQVEIALFATDAALSLQYAPIAAESGAIVIDTSGAFCNEPDVPLVIGAVNPQALVDHNLSGIIACPDSAATQLLSVIAPLHRQVGIRALHVTSCQSVSAQGKQGVEELAAQTAALLNTRDPQTSVFSKQVAFNVLPQSAEYDDTGMTLNERAMVDQVHTVLGDPSIDIHVSCLSVPVFFGHSETVHIETETPIGSWDVRDILQDLPDIEVLDEQTADGYPTAVTDAAGNEIVYVSRIRNGLNNESSVDMFIVADNVRYGAASNSVQIAELLVAHYL